MNATRPGATRGRLQYCIHKGLEVRSSRLRDANKAVCSKHCMRKQVCEGRRHARITRVWVPDRNQIVDHPDDFTTEFPGSGMKLIESLRRPPRRVQHEYKVIRTGLDIVIEF